jgi:CHAT domain-containing protein
LSIGARGTTSKGAFMPLSGGETLLDYALVGDTLLRWTVNQSGHSLNRFVVPRARVVQTISRARLGLQRSSTDSLTQHALKQLYDWLIPTSLGSRGALQRVLIVADQVIAEVPFPALWDSLHERFLIEAAPLRFSTSVVDARSPAPRHARATRVLFVAEPAVDSRVFFGLPPMPATLGEVTASAAEYPSATILTRADVDSARVTDWLEKVEVFHFAGHALFDEDAPDRSVLAIAPRGLSGSAIGSMDLRGLRLVVLSACETARAPEHRSSAFGGFAEAFLAAGALGVVGSLWPVGDVPTAQIMVDFHSAYAHDGDAASALRAAQVAAIKRQQDSRGRSMEWAAFRYAGR